MPIITVTWRFIPLVVIATVLVSVSFPTQAKNVRYIIRHASQLEDDKRIRSVREPYILDSTANVVFAQCGEELAITEPQRQFLAAHFATTGAEYVQAFRDVFEERTGVASPPAMLEKYVTYIRAVQQNAVDSAAKVIQQKGCNTSQIHKIISHYTALQNAEATTMQSLDINTTQPPSATTTP